MKIKETGDLRFDLCEIVFHYAKGATFTIESMLHEKKDTLLSLARFIEQHADALAAAKGDSAFWNPYRDHDTKYLPKPHDYAYPTKDGSCAMPQHRPNETLDSDYFLDPAKIQAAILTRDVSLMDMSGEGAKKVFEIDLQTLELLLETVGDIPCYSGERLLPYLERSFDEAAREMDESIANTSGDFADYLARKRGELDDNKILCARVFALATKYFLDAAAAPGKPEPSKPRI